MHISRRDAMKLMASAAGLSAASTGLNTNAAATSESMMTAIHTHPYRLKKLYHGACYYPELWPEEDIDRDIPVMKKLGINVVRIGEFAWSIMEPREGRISLDFFKRTLDKFHHANIDVIFCTPTPTPPVWLSYQHPERAFVNQEGETMVHGARQHLSYEHPYVRKACFRIVEACAKELGQHPALIAWQLDNEIKCHVAEDFSESAVHAWHGWLKKKFGTIAELNAAWGTHIWSQHYQKFEQVPAPLKTPFLHNASLSTAYRMFCRESIAEFLDEQSKIIRRFSSRPITHNTNPAFSVNHERLFKNLDFASWDAYPSFQQWDALVFRSDLYRAAKQGRPFWLMETSSSHNGWLGNHQRAHPPGFLAAEAALTYSLGGEGMCYWLWRQQRSGAELPHSAVMSAWFQPGIGYREVEKVEEVRKKLEPLLVESRSSVPEVGITWSDHARAMIQTEPLDKRENFPKNYRGLIQHWHGIVREAGFHRDVRFEGAALDGLKLLITPAMPYVSEEFIRRVEKFVRAGGIWIAGPVTGTRGKEHTVPTDSGLGLLDNFAGVKTAFVFPLTQTDATGTAFNQTVPLSGWCAAHKPVHADTRVIGNLHAEQIDKHAFISERTLGKGKVVLLSAHPQGDAGKKLITTLIQHYADEARVELRFEASTGVLVCPRTDYNNEDLWIAINMQEEDGTLRVPAGSVDALTGKTIRTRQVQLKRYAWRAIAVKT